MALSARISRLKLRRQTPYSTASAMSALVLFLTVVIDIGFMADRATPRVLQVVLLVICAACVIIPTVMGHRYPSWAGLIPASIIALASVYFIGISGEDQAVMSSMQELPMVSLYLGWFYRGLISRSFMFLFGGAIIAAVLWGPSFGPDKHFSHAIGFASVGIMVFCFEAGWFVQRGLERLAIHDHLTGVLNRRGLGERFLIERERSRRMGETLMVTVIDFDHFKSVNDELGHAAGDEVLRSSVDAWRLRLFDSDVIGRVGGDEFVILLPQRSRRDAESLLQLLQQATSHPWSWGLSVADEGLTLEEVLERADVELYARKARLQS